MDHQLSILQLVRQRIHAAGWGTGDAGSIRSKSSPVAGAYELILPVLPRNTAAKMRANGGENLQLTIFSVGHIH